MGGTKRKIEARTSESSNEDSYECSSSNSSSSSSSSNDDYDYGSRGGSYSDASSTSDSDESESLEVPSARLANLSFNHVFQADEDCSSDEDMFQRNGKSKARMTAALKRKCCKGRCKRNLKPIWKSVCYLVSCFWALSKQGQDGLLWSLQNPVFIPQIQGDDESNDESEDSDFNAARQTPRTRWHFEGALLQKATPPRPRVDDQAFVSSSLRD